ncbi:RNA 2',3'-cyclic phosphodiesterase [Siminovitchia sediminis]|uniref:RNA 2',3'-cyclic phosphodiesterase n=1 Tax=Siminovitchia sediminis TaxID=1274353 RepID=A0ABW4KFZ7_9BACI
MDTSHYFFALSLPNEVKDPLWEISQQAKEIFPFKSWVHHADYHITLAFLGKAEQHMLADAVSHVRESLQGVPSFQLSLNHAGTFGRQDAPRILWVNTKDSASLRRVRDHVYTACGKAGFQLETRPFKPHITIARSWVSERKFQMKALEESVFSCLPDTVFSIKEVVLYRTHPQKLPKYEKAECFPLV